MSKIDEPDRHYSLPPLVGSRVRILTQGWAKDATGMVTSHEATDGYSRSEHGPVIGYCCTVTLDTPIPTRWADYQITTREFLWSWQVGPI